MEEIAQDIELWYTEFEVMNAVGIQTAVELPAIPEQPQNIPDANVNGAAISELGFNNNEVAADAVQVLISKRNCFLNTRKIMIFL